MTFPRYRTVKPKSRGSLRKIAFGLAFVGLVVMLIYTRFQQFLPNKIRSEFQTKLNRELNSLGMLAGLREAEFLPGEGIRLSQLWIKDGASPNSESIVEINDIFIHSPSNLQNLALGHLHIEAIDITGAKLTANRFQNGSWQLTPLLKHLANLCDGERHPFSIRLLDSNIRIVDRTSASKSVRSIRDINLVAKPIVHENRELTQIEGSCSGLSVSQLHYRAFVDPKQKGYFAEIQAQNAQLTAELFKLLPERTASLFDDVETLGGRLDLRGSVSGQLTDASATKFQVLGKIQSLSLSDKRLPLGFKNCSVDFELTNEGLDIRRATGRAGQGTFDVSYKQHGLFRRNAWSAKGRLVDFNFIEKIRPWLPNSCKQFCDDFRPAGTSNIDFEIAFDGQKYRRNLQAQITNMEFNFVKFPYPFRRCYGDIRWIDEDCRFELHSQIGQKPVRMSGRAIRPGPNSTYAVDIEAAGNFTIDEKLLAALDPYPALKRQVLAFRPSGFVSGFGRIEKLRPDSDNIERSFDIRIHDCNVRHDSFQYPISAVNGLMRVRNQQCVFENVTGSNGNAQIRCDGTWDQNTGLELRFLCRQVPLDENLRNAVNLTIQEVWNAFRPRGTVGLMRVQMSLPVGATEANLIVNANLANDEIADSSQISGPPASSVSIFPTWFPYEISQLSGKVDIGDGRITLTDLQGKHRRTRMNCQGNGVYSNQGWSVSLKKMLVLGVEVDEDLLQALPKPLSQPLRTLDFKGLVSVKGEITMGGPNCAPTSPAPPQPLKIAQAGYTTPSDQSSTQLFWDLRLDVDQAAMQLGMPVENVFGMVKLVGEYDGYKGACAGELAIDSLIFQGAQIKNLQGPIWIDENGVYAGTLAKQHRQSEPRQIVGEAFGGQVRLDAQKLAENNGEFLVQASLTEASLKEIVNDFAPHAQHVTGTSYGAIRVTGDETSAYSFRGEGTLQLRDAHIYELPPILSLLKILLPVKEVNRTAFDSCSVDFSIDGNHVDLERIELIGDAVSLIGNGEINFSRQLDLNFYSVLGRNRFYIPLLSEIYRAGSQQILWINIDGTLDQPNTNRHVLPQLNDTIRALMQPPNRSFQFGNEFSAGLPFTPLNSPIGTRSFPIRR